MIDVYVERANATIINNTFVTGQQQFIYGY